jgi:CelD/BcsL family acetyltransferase involved in cellulose biosynthesis
LRRAGLRVLRFLGDPLIQYGDALFAAAAAPVHAGLALDAALDPRVADLVHLRRVRADSRLAAALSNRCRVVAREQAPFVDVAAPGPRSTRDRRELRRLRRRLQDHGPWQFEVLRGAAAAAALGEAIALKRRWLAEQGAFSSVIGVPAWESVLARVAADADLLAAARLTVAGRFAAGEIALVQDGRWHAFLGAFAPEFARSGPGQVQMAETIAHCGSAAIGVYDLLPPLDGYKARLAHGSVPVHDHALPLTLAGRAGMAALRVRPTLKRLVGGMPPAARRLVLPRRW